MTASAEHMPQQAPQPGVPEPAQQRGAEQLGFLGQQQFAERAQQELATRSFRDKTLAGVSDQLNELGVALNPAAAPIATHKNGIAGFGLLTEADKAAIHDSDNPLVALWGRSNLREAETQRSHGVGKEKNRLSIEHQESELAMLSSLGLVHGTRFDGLVTAIEQGGFLPNREVSDTDSGNTMFMDRDLGLDGFVFADFGRPNKLRSHTPPEVEVIFDLQAFTEPGSFATEQDMADCGSLEEYLSTAVESEYFLEAAQLKLDTTVAAKPNNDIVFGQRLTASEFVQGVDGNPNTAGEALFSTWEVKMPKVANRYIKKIIFRDPAQHEAFVAQFGKSFRSELLQPGEAASYYDEQEVAANYEKLAAANAETLHAEMTAALAALPADQKEVVVLGLQPTSRKVGLLHLERDVRNGTYATKVANTPEELAQEIGVSPNGTIAGMEDFPIPITDTSHRYMRVAVERAKEDHNLVRFIEAPQLVAS